MTPAGPAPGTLLVRNADVLVTMDARRREAVLDAALRTSPASLARPRVLASLPG